MLSATFAEQAVSLLLWLCVGSSPRSYQLCSPQMLAADSSRGTATEKPYEACFQICCSRCAAAEGNDAAARREMSRPVSDGGKDPRGALGEFVIFFRGPSCRSESPLQGIPVNAHRPRAGPGPCTPAAVCGAPCALDRHSLISMTGACKAPYRTRCIFFLTDVAESRSGRAGGGCPDPAAAATARRIRGPM
jgi:hypothetical protein